MWPFKKKQSAADVAIEWMPQAIDVAAQRWIEFEDQAFAATMPLNEKIYHFTTGLKQDLNQWEAFKGSPESIFY
jgi:ketopantoate reductase